MKLYVGIDPSYTATGVVVLDKDSVVLACAAAKLPKDGNDITRALAMRNEVLEMIASCGTGSDAPHIAIENYSLNSRFGVAMAVTLGTVLRLGIIDKGWTYVEPVPNAVKAFALMPKGNAAEKRAKKQKPVAEVEKLWGFKHKSKDVIDAYVLAQIARAHGGAQPIGHLHERQIDVLAALKSS